MGEDVRGDGVLDVRVHLVLDGLGPDLSADVIVIPEASELAGRIRELRRENGGKEPVSLLAYLAGRGVPVRPGDTAPLVGLGLLEGAE